MTEVEVNVEGVGAGNVAEGGVVAEVMATIQGLDSRKMALVGVDT